MAVSYNILWKLLIDKEMSKADLGKAAGIAPNTMTGLRRNYDVTLIRLCKMCDIVGADYGKIYRTCKIRVKCKQWGTTPC